MRRDAQRCAEMRRDAQRCAERSREVARRVALLLAGAPPRAGRCPSLLGASPGATRVRRRLLRLQGPKPTGPPAPRTTSSLTRAFRVLGEAQGPALPHQRDPAPGARAGVVHGRRLQRAHGRHPPLRRHLHRALLHHDLRLAAGFRCAARSPAQSAAEAAELGRLRRD